jgi:hypothetical protein
MKRGDAGAPRPATAPDAMAALRRQYGCGPGDLTGNPKALFERHLAFDNVADPATVGPRERYEAFARSSGTSSRVDGSAPSRPTSVRTPSASTTSRWNS